MCSSSLIKAIAVGLSVLLSSAVHALDIAACGVPTEDLPIMQKIIKHESGAKQFAIGINVGNGTSKSLFAEDYATAVAWSKELLQRGYPSIDMGFGQINSKNLQKLGISIEQVFDACTNIKSAHAIFKQNMSATGGNVMAALSMYNTGKPNSERGTKYAMAVLGNAGLNKEMTTFAQALKTNPYRANAMLQWDMQTAESTWKVY